MRYEQNKNSNVRFFYQHPLHWFLYSLLEEGRRRKGKQWQSLYLNKRRLVWGLRSSGFLQDYYQQNHPLTPGPSQAARKKKPRQSIIVENLPRPSLYQHTALIITMSSPTELEIGTLAVTTVVWHQHPVRLHHHPPPTSSSTRTPAPPSLCRTQLSRWISCQ